LAPDDDGAAAGPAEAAADAAALAAAAGAADAEAGLLSAICTSMTLVPVGPVTISPSPSCRKKVYESLLRRYASASSPRARARCRVPPST
jgi:hypothetical protein